MELSEDEFVSAVEDAMSKMKQVAENPIGLKLLETLVKAQLAYFKEAYEVESFSYDNSLGYHLSSLSILDLVSVDA